MCNSTSHTGPSQLWLLSELFHYQWASCLSKCHRFEPKSDQSGWRIHFCHINEGLTEHWRGGASRRSGGSLSYQIVLVQTFKNVLLMSGFGEQKNDILLMQGICAGDLNGRKRHGFSIMNLKLHKTIKNRFGWHKWQKPSINQSLNVSKNVI